MARRIVLTMLALIGALLVTTIVPLGLITTGHERSSFQQDTILSARTLAGLAEDRLADQPPAGTATMARAMAQARKAGEQVGVYSAGRRSRHRHGWQRRRDLRRRADLRAARPDGAGQPGR